MLEKVVARIIFKTNGWVIGGGVSAICCQQYVDLNGWNNDHIEVQRRYNIHTVLYATRRQTMLNLHVVGAQEKFGKSCTFVGWASVAYCNIKLESVAKKVLKNYVQLGLRMVTQWRLQRFFESW